MSVSRESLCLVFLTTSLCAAKTQLDHCLNAVASVFIRLKGVSIHAGFEGFDTAEKCHLCTV